MAVMALEVEKIEYRGAESRVPRKQDFEEISEEYTSELALSEFENTYRDLVD